MPLRKMMASEREEVMLSKDNFTGVKAKIKAKQSKQPVCDAAAAAQAPTGSQRLHVGSDDETVGRRM
jgi:hypothetical protein